MLHVSQGEGPRLGKVATRSKASSTRGKISSTPSLRPRLYITERTPPYNPESLSASTSGHSLILSHHARLTPSPSKTEIMSFTTPRNVPNFASTTRRHEDVYWSSSGRSRHTSSSFNAGLSISPFPFRGRDRELPMYKDKPYSRRRRSWRFWLGLVLVLLICWLYVVPRLRGGHVEKSTKSASHATWTQRRQDVVVAMQKSWGGYEKYAWGMCSTSVSVNLQQQARTSTTRTLRPDGTWYRRRVWGGSSWTRWTR
jgi:hypothetical protein